MGLRKAKKRVVIVCLVCFICKDSAAYSRVKKRDNWQEEGRTDAHVQRGRRG